MPDILLIQPPIRDFYLTAKRTIPYGLACIASALRREGFSVGILDALATSRSRRVDPPPEMSYLRDLYAGPDISPFGLFHDFRHFGLDFETIGDIARRSGAFLIGISSLFTAYCDEALLTAEAVRRHCPEAFIVMGGHHPTEMPEEVLKYSFIDFIVRGEGEAALPLLARAVRDGTPLEKVPGIGSRGGDIRFNPPAVMRDLDDMPPPAPDLIYTKFYQRKKRPCAVVVASRGCPLKCTYCSIGCASWSPFRLKSIQAVMDEMERAVFGFGVRFIDFEDENISFDRKWFLSLLDAIWKKFAGLGLELRAMNGLFPPTLDEEVIRAMKEAGFTALNLSLCSTSPGQLKRFNRPCVCASFENALDSAQKHGLETVGYIIVGAPGQCARDSVSDLLYLADKKVLAGVSVFYPAPGSVDFELCRTQNLLPVHLGLMRSTALPICDTTTREESATLLRLGRVLNFIKSLSACELGQVRAAASLGPAAVAERIEEVRTGRSNCNRPATPVSNTHREMRRTIGKLLLSLFLHDAIVRGITPEGKIFNHRASHELCLLFREGILRQIQ